MRGKELYGPIGTRGSRHCKMKMETDAVHTYQLPNKTHFLNSLIPLSTLVQNSPSTLIALVLCNKCLSSPYTSNIPKSNPPRSAFQSFSYFTMYPSLSFVPVSQLMLISLHRYCYYHAYLYPSISRPHTTPNNSPHSSSSSLSPPPVRYPPQSYT